MSDHYSATVRMWIDLTGGNWVDVWASGPDELTFQDNTLSDVEFFCVIDGEKVVKKIRLISAKYREVEK